MYRPLTESWNINLSVFALALILDLSDAFIYFIAQIF